MNGIYTRLVSGLLFPLHEKFKSHDSVSLRKELELTQWLSTEELYRLQFSKLKRFLSDVETNVPYYQEKFKACDFIPSEIKALKELRRIPLLTKSEIGKHQERLKARDAAPLSRFNTGGSSGEPLVFFLSNKRVSHDIAAKWRATRWWAVDIGDPEIVIWGSPIELGAQDLIREIRDRLFRSHLLTAFEMTDDKLDSFIETIASKKPKMLFGYPSAIAHIARYAEKKKKSLAESGLKVVFVTSERLYDYQRQQIETIFGCPVANGYGGRDAGFIAHECPSGGMHIMAEDIIVEIIDNDGNSLLPGQSGEVVVTHMSTRDFPFIRYRTGDVAIMDEKPCRCGRGLPVLREIQGRSTDFVIAQDGTVLHGLALIYVLRDLPGIKEFKIIQTSLSETQVQIVRDDGFGREVEEKIKGGIRQRLGNDVNVVINICDDIPKEKSGKYRYIISHVAAS